MRLSPSIALLRTQSDERLTALAREGHEPAFTALVERYRRTVLAACRRVLPEARAEDAAQQVFVSAWRALGRGDEVRDVRPWLQRIARNTSLNALRVSGYDYDELADSLSAAEAPEAELERRDVIRQTLAGLAALPDNQREALLRSAVQGAAHADSALYLGLTEGATRQLVLRARTTLRSAVSAVTPLPLVTWAAQAASTGGGAAASGIGEAAAGGSAAGASVLMA
ncbi:MAG: RNA polymerase sigma factor, partial [Solirubrobacteraceae bacterium]